MEKYIEIIGHIIGFISVALFFYSYQVSQKTKLMIIQTVATALGCIQYLFIGAYSGFALNIVCIIRNFVFYSRDKKQRRDWISPVILAAGIAVASFFSWEGMHSLLITVGLVFNTVCMGMCNQKTFRKTILVSSTCILIYNVFAHSYSGMLSESISLISAMIGIFRYRSTKASESKENQTTV